MIEQPIKLGSFVLKNRIVVPPIVRNLANEDGTATSQLLASYTEHAKSGAAMVIVEASFVQPDGRILNNPQQLGITKDEHCHGLSLLANAIHEQGVPALIQLVHSGRVNKADVPIAPSAVPFEDLPTPRKMSLSDIAHMRESYHVATRRAIFSGFDGIEVHSAHGYLLSQFLSPSSNKREDEYGGTLENRMRLLLEIVRDARRQLGKGRILSVRLGACDLFPGGLKLDEAAIAAKRLREESVDLINVSVGIVPTLLGGSQTRREGNFAVLSNKVRQASGPVVAVAGKITKKATAEKILQEGKADLVCVARAIICDPLWPKKVLGLVDAPIKECRGCLPKCKHYVSGCP